MGESGKVILQVSIGVFSGAVENFFGQRWLSPPPIEKIGCTPNDRTNCIKLPLITSHLTNALTIFTHTHTYISYTVNGAQHAVKHVFIILRFWNVEILLHFKCSKISTLQNRKIMMQQKRVLQCVFNSALAYLSGLSWAN